MGEKSGIEVITGNDEYAIKKAAVALTTSLAPEDSFNFETIDAQVDEVEGALQRMGMLREAILTLPFGFGTKLIWWKNVNFLADTPLGRAASVTEGLEQLIPVLKEVDGQRVKLVMSVLGVDKRRTFFKTLQSLAKVQTFDVPDAKRDPEEAILQIEQKLRQNGLKPDAGVADRIFEVLGVDPRAWEQEIEKLQCAHEGGDLRVTVEEVKVMVQGSREVVIWDFCDAAISGRVTEAIHLLNQLEAQEESEVGILILLGNQVRQAALVGVMMEQKLARLSGGGRFTKLEVTAEGEAMLPKKKSGETVNLFMLSKVAEKSRRRPAAFWTGAVERVYQANRKLLTSAGDKRQVLESLIMSLG